jgi:hypothetical protein
MTRPTDLYLADLLNEAADTLDCYARVPGSPTIVGMHRRLKAASKALRENPAPGSVLGPVREMPAYMDGLTGEWLHGAEAEKAIEQRFRQVTNNLDQQPPYWALPQAEELLKGVPGVEVTRIQDATHVTVAEAQAEAAIAALLDMGILKKVP